MRTNIKTTNIKLTADLSEYVNRKISSFEKLLSRQTEAAIVDVEIGRTTKHHQSGDIYRAEINIHVGQRSFRAVKETGDLYSSIDAARDQMFNELGSDKDKRTSLVKRGGQKIKNLIKGFPWWRRNRG